MTPTHLIRLTQAAMLAAIVAVFVPNMAQAKSTTPAAPDWIERYALEHPYGVGTEAGATSSNWFTRNDDAHFGRSDAASGTVIDGRSPDTRDAVYATQFQISDGRSPDTLDAAQSVQPSQAQVIDGRSADTLDAAQNAQSAQLQVLDARSPDTRDAAQAIQPIELTGSSGFHWSDAGIGAASGAGLLLLLGGSMLLLLRMHRQDDVQAT